MPVRVIIEKRPDEDEERSRTGDWEADTIIGKGDKSQLFTIKEHKTRLALIAKRYFQDFRCIG